jgi:hypothetical protein
MKLHNLVTRLAVGLAAVLIAISPVAAADIFIVSFDGPGVGFNDPTPAAPVGGNPGTTLGEQRTYVFLLAAQLWGDAIESDAPIYVGATFAPLGCTPTAGTLGSAGTAFVFRDFPGATFASTWYHSALADSLAGEDLNPGFIDVFAQFNSRLDDDPNCLGGSGWYYGFDHNEGQQFDLLAVVMHEMAHGLGFANFIDEPSGSLFLGYPDIYSLYTYDLSTGLTWDQMTDAERQASAVNGPNVVWNGPSVTGMAPMVLSSRPSVKILRPASIAGSFEAQPAAFGPALVGPGGTTGLVVLADDGVGAGTDACEPIVNNLSGKIALIDRGTCAFTLKVSNAQAAGAKGVIVANNQPTGPAPMGGNDPSIAIPSVGITLAQGDAIKAELSSGVNAKLLLDKDFQAGTSEGHVRLYAPAQVAPGSSISHWDTTATPNLLMEPFINSDLTPAFGLDLTPYLFEDIGWMLSY